MSYARKYRLLTQTITPRKLRNFWNIYTSYFQAKNSRDPQLKGMPIKIGIEPTTACNLRCPACISGLRAFSRPTGMLDMELFKKMIDELSPELIYLLMYFQGEPFLNKNFLPMVRYAHEKKVYVATSTNGHFITAEKAIEVVKSGLSEVIFSIDGTTQESYATYRIGGKLERVIQSMRYLLEARKKLGKLNPFVILQFIVLRPNQHQIEDVRILGRQLGVDHVAIKTAQLYDFEEGHELIPDLPKFSRYKKTADGKYAIKNKLENQCWKMWQGMEITWDGKVLPCCFDKDAEYIMGEFPETSIREIWQSETYKAFRRKLLTSRSHIEMCQNCSEGTKVWA
ncbi:MAG: radical SAM/SPASM domain-containing protein [Bacteroidota bacterium]